MAKRETVEVRRAEADEYGTPFGLKDEDVVMVIPVRLIRLRGGGWACVTPAGGARDRDVMGAFVGALDAFAVAMMREDESAEREGSVQVPGAEGVN
jgi:hypothetical protein